MNEIGKKIKTLRKNKHLSQEELAYKMKVSQSTIAKWENGTQSPRSKNIEILTEILETTFSELFNDVNNHKEEQDKKHQSMAFWGQIIDNTKEIIEHGEPEEISYARSSLELAYQIISQKKDTTTLTKNKASIKAGANSKNSITQS